jgi:hypothetical protein
MCPMPLEKPGPAMTERLSVELTTFIAFAFAHQARSAQPVRAAVYHPA